jgi:predicted DNA-binding mobile mystery protein A
MNMENARKQLEKRLSPLRSMESELATPPRGWIKAIREALNMSAVQMAKRLGVARSRINALEKAEVTGNVTVKTMREAAEAINCRFVYAIVPVKPMDEIMRDRAKIIAKERLQFVDHSMRLEDQAMDEDDREQQTDRIIDEILEKEARRLWSEL